MKSLTIIPAALAFAGLCCAASAQPASPHQAPELGGAASSSLEQTAATDAAAQPAPPSPRPMADAPPPPPPPPPPGGPRADGAPPPHGPSIRVERDAGGTLRLDVHCGDADSAKSCADTTLAIFDKVNAVASTAK